MRNPDGTRKLSPEQLEDLARFLRMADEAIRQVHGRPPCPPKPKNIPEGDFLPPTDWTPEGEGEGE